MSKARQVVPATPTVPEEKIRLLRARLILEEACETIHALGFGLQVGELKPRPGGIDLVDIADGCGDLSVVTIGTLSACGIEDEPVLREIDENNLTKFRPGHTIDEFGKLLKPADHKPPDLAGVLREMKPKSIE
jgi:hypothetical protein